MKAMVCEMCNSNDIQKQDGVYVCQHCGTKYSVEEAKKLMFEGTVKIDNSDFVERYLQNARRAKSKEDWAETEKYYNLVEQNQPQNIEAIFYSAYGKAKTSLVESDIFKRRAAFKVLQNCVSIIDDNYNTDMSIEVNQKEIILNISDDIFGMASSEYVYNYRTNGYGNVTWDDKLETRTLFNNLEFEFMNTLENIAQKYPESEKSKSRFFYEIALKHAVFLLEHGCLRNTEGIRNLIITYHSWIHEIDPNHDIPVAEKTQNKTRGCYIATAVYGSYDCPQVWVLRRYRDFKLASKWYGRAFIRTYYAVSPTLVKLFGETGWFKKMWKGKLDRIVCKLQSEGFDDTPYSDRQW